MPQDKIQWRHHRFNHPIASVCIHTNATSTLATVNIRNYTLTGKRRQETRPTIKKRDGHLRKGVFAAETVLL